MWKLFIPSLGSFNKGDNGIYPLFVAAMFYINILYSEGYDMDYVGHTNEPARWLTEHNTIKENKFTAKFRPCKLAISFEVSQSRGETTKVERSIKRQRSKQSVGRRFESSPWISSGGFFTFAKIELWKFSPYEISLAGAS